MADKKQRINVADEWTKGVKKLHIKFRLTRIPIIGKYLYRNTWVGDPSTKAWLVPVNEKIQVPKSVHLPIEIVKILIKKSSIRAKMPFCVCREAFDCQNYPHELGTILLGNAFINADEKGLTFMTVEETLAHAEKAVGLGLAPTIIWERENQTVFGGKMNQGLAICFCCNCCCDYRLGLRIGNKEFRKKVFRPEGVSVIVSEACQLCGTCTESEVCSASAITLGKTKAVINLNKCVGCGACIRVCPEKAISFELDPEVDIVGQLLKKVEQYTDIS